jgi:type II secretory pathway predicted ATPase ExeA
MYETHFGLNKRPFRALAAGTDVFVGPQTVATMAGLKKALTSPDSIVAVSGPAGVGKTTLVRRALDAVGDNQVIVSVGRMQLGHDEVLELLLDEMGAQMPAGTVQRFTTFRRLLKDHADKGVRVIVVVEDASRVGTDALSELEALTAADAGVSDGANIVLMGGEDVNEVLKVPDLARLKQRLRLFEQGSSDVLHSLSGGIPRMANNLVESVLTDAAEIKQDRISVDLIKQVARDEYGLDTAPDAIVGDVSEVPARDNDEPKVEEPKVEAAATEEALAGNDEQDDSIPELIQDTRPNLEILAPALAGPTVFDTPQDPDAAETTAVTEPSEDNIPTLSGSMRLETSTKTATGSESEAEPDEELAAALEAAQVLPADEAVPEWERDPTLAQLRPDLDALEHAMAVAQGIAPAADGDAEQDDRADEPAEPVPEITLDRAIQAKIEKAAELLSETAPQEDEPKESEKTTAEILAQAKAKPASNTVEAQLDSPESFVPKQTAQPQAKPPAAPAVAAPPAPPAAKAPPVSPVAKESSVSPVAKQPPAAPTMEEPPAKVPTAETPETELKKIAANLARAKTIDDCDDKMAETLFGEEFSLMAAQVAANAPPELSTNDELDQAPEEVAAAPLADFEGAAAVSVDLESEPNRAARKIDLTGGNKDLASTQQRLATVRALNRDPAAPTPATEAAALSHNEAPTPPPPIADQPESIEDQINTSITQTLKALNVRPSSALDDDDDEDREKTGFFDRFRRS